MKMLRSNILLLSIFFSPALVIHAGDQPTNKTPNYSATIEKLDDPDPTVRRRALADLARAGKNAKTAIPHVALLLNDKHPIVRIEAATALRKIDPHTKLALPVLLDAMRVKGNITVRCSASIAFSGFDASVVPALIDLFREKDRSVDMWASAAIVGIGKKAEPHLLKARNDPDRVVRENVEETLKSLKFYLD